MAKTCEKCQSIPRYRVKPSNKRPPVLACWAHLPRVLDEQLDNVDTTTVEVGRMK